MPEAQSEKVQIKFNIITVMQVVGFFTAGMIMTVGIVSLVMHPQSATLEASDTIDNINLGFSVMMLSAYLCVTAVYLMLLVFRIPVLILHFAAFRCGYIWTGAFFILSGALCIGLCGLLGLILGAVVVIVGIVFIVIRLICGQKVEIKITQ